MRFRFEDSAGRFEGNLLVVLAAISLLFPSSALVLCISPDGHVAVEDFNAPCCHPHDISLPGKGHPGNGSAAVPDCHNCTDLFMTPNGRGATSESFDHAVANPLADECLENHISTDICLSLWRSDALSSMDAPIPVSSSVPLRC